MSETERRLETELDDIGARHLLGHIHNGHTSYQQPTEEVRRHQSILREATRLARNERQRKDKRFFFISNKLIVCLAFMFQIEDLGNFRSSILRSYYSDKMQILHSFFLKYF